MPCCPKFLYPTWKRINVIAVYCDKMNKFSIFGFKKMVFGRFLPQCFDFTRGMFVTTMSWEKEVMNKQMWNAPVEKICCLCKQWLKIHCLPSRGTWNLLPFLTKNCSVTQCSFTSCCHFCNLCQLWWQESATLERRWLSGNAYLYDQKTVKMISCIPDNWKWRLGPSFVA